MTTIWEGTLRKMRVAPDADGLAVYALADGWWNPDERTADVPLAPYLGARLEIRFDGRITCVYCGREGKKSFGQGFCYPCFQARAEADQCIVKPELCHYHDDANPCRDDAFALSHCFRPHILYVSLTSGLKIGITREANLPTRWLDQGATAAVPLAVLPDRRTVGLLEAELRDQAGLADRTHWTRLLKLEEGEGDLAGHAAQVAELLAARGVDLLPASDRAPRRFRYPVRTYPTKVKSINLDREGRAGGILEGIKGQYLIFTDGVINLRKYTGYAVTVAAD